MRYLALLFTSTFLLGCGSTRVIEKNLDAEALEQVDGLCAEACNATVSFVDRSQLQSDWSADSVYQRLEKEDLTIILRDSTVLQGRLSGFRPPDVWFVDRRDQQGKRIGAVELSVTSVEGIVVRTPVRNLSLDTRNSLLVRLDRDRTVPLTSVVEIQVNQTTRNHGRGFVTGFLAGALPVGLLFAGAMAD